MKCSDTAGKMRKNRIRVLVGDEVLCELTPYDLTAAAHHLSIGSPTRGGAASQPVERAAEGGDILASGKSIAGSELIARLGVEPDAIIAADIDETPHGRVTRAMHGAWRARRSAAASDDGSSWRATRWSPPAAASCPRPRMKRLRDGLERKVRAVGTACAVRHCPRAPDGESSRERLNETVVWKRLSREEIDAYLASGEWEGGERRLRHPEHRGGPDPPAFRAAIRAWSAMPLYGPQCSNCRVRHCLSHPRPRRAWHRHHARC